MGWLVGRSTGEPLNADLTHNHHPTIATDPPVVHRVDPNVAGTYLETGQAQKLGQVVSKSPGVVSWPPGKKNNQEESSVLAIETFC